MRAHGHIGLALLLLSLLTLATACASGSPPGPRLLLAVAAALPLSLLPDVDLKIRVSKHRGLSHSLMAAAIVAALAALAYPEPSLRHYVFAAAFVSFYSHVLGDVISVRPVPALYPVVRRRLALRLVRADDPYVNAAALASGLVAALALASATALGSSCVAFGLAALAATAPPAVVAARSRAYIRRLKRGT